MICKVDAFPKAHGLLESLGSFRSWSHLWPDACQSESTVPGRFFGLQTVHVGIVLVILILSFVREDVLNIVEAQSQMYFM